MTDPDELVWVAAVRRGITWHRIGGHGVDTVCSRSMHHGQSISRMRAVAELAGEPCPRCWTAAGPVGIGPADEAAHAGTPFPSGAAPAPSSAAATAGDGVSPTAGAAVSSPAAAPDPTTPARAAVTNSDSGCPGGHHTPRETT